MAKKTDTVTDICLKGCLESFDRARGSLELAVSEDSLLRPLAESGLEMVDCYRTDAANFTKDEEFVTAFAAINYAHAWIGCFKELGLFHAVPGDDLFMSLTDDDSERSSRITEEKIGRYLDITTRARKKLRIAPPVRSFDRKLALQFLEKSETYFKDAVDFRREGDVVKAFAAVNYSHAWLDAGARMGLFDVDEDDVLFTLYE